MLRMTDFWLYNTIISNTYLQEALYFLDTPNHVESWIAQRNNADDFNDIQVKEKEGGTLLEKDIFCINRKGLLLQDSHPNNVKISSKLTLFLNSIRYNYYTTAAATTVTATTTAIAIANTTTTAATIIIMKVVSWRDC